MLYFDIDGVIRNLQKSLKIDLENWNDFNEFHYDKIKNDPKRHLENAPYYENMRKIINSYDQKYFITCSSERFKDYTENFLKRIFNNFLVIYVENPESKLSYLGSDDYLVDDYPFYRDKRVILVERKYNKDYVKNYEIVWRLN